MIVQVMGLLDLLSALIVLFSGLVPKSIILYAGYWLIGKGGFFFMTTRNIVSFIDIICGIYVVLLAYGLHINFISIIVLIYLFQKAFMSFIRLG